MIKRITGFLFLAFFAVSASIAQNLNYINPPKNAPVSCKCVDSSGNLFVVFSEDVDTTRIYKMDNKTKAWSLMPYRITGKPLNPTGGACAFLGSTMLIAASGFNGYLNLSMVNSQNQISYLGTLAVRKAFLSSAPRIDMLTDRDKIYLYGAIDSFNATRSDSLFYFDGSAIRQMRTPPRNINSRLAIVNDTLFLSVNRNVYARGPSGLWVLQSSLLHDDNINSMTNFDGSLLTAQNNGRIRMFSGNKELENVNTGLQRPELSSIDTNVFVCGRPYSPLEQPGLYTYHRPGRLAFRFRILGEDSIEMRLTPAADQLFVDQRVGLRTTEYNYRYLAEVKYLTMDAPSKDTVYYGVYVDLNKNGRMDQSDSFLNVLVYDSVTNKSYLSSKGLIEFIEVYDNERLRLYADQSFNGQGCLNMVGLPYSGKGYRNKISLDTIMIPLQAASGRFNLKVGLTAAPFVRLNLEQDLMVSVQSTSCLSAGASRTLKVTINPGADIVSTTPAYSSINGNELTFNYAQNYTSGNLFKIKVKYDNTKFKIGDKVWHRAQILNSDSTLSDNLDSISQIMRYSYDPNVKLSVPSGRIKESIKKVRYTIHFQNEGNDDAWRVRVVDTMQFNLPIYAFQMVGSSHRYKVSAVGQEVTWTFDDINLKPKSVSEEGSRGYICFDALLMGEMAIGDSIVNNASIYFDFNEPIHTNAAVVKRVKDDSYIPEIDLSKLQLGPNPFVSEIQVNNNSNRTENLKVFSTDGKLVAEYTVVNGSGRIFLPEELSEGIYLFITESGLSFKMLKVAE